MSFASIKSDPSIVVAEMDWPGTGRGKYEKVPTIVAMSQDNIGHRAFTTSGITSLFGFQVPPGVVVRSYFKTFLDGEAKSSTYDDPILISTAGKKLIQIDQRERNWEAMVVTLKHLKEIHLEKMRTALGLTLKDLSFRYVFTHPAACSPQGIRSLEEAVNDAGFVDDAGNRPEFLSEAHAAAMAGFIGCRSQHGSQAWEKFFKVSDIYVDSCEIHLT